MLLFYCDGCHAMHSIRIRMIRSLLSLLLGYLYVIRECFYKDVFIMIFSGTISIYFDILDSKWSKRNKWSLSGNYFFNNTYLEI